MKSTPKRALRSLVFIGRALCMLHSITNLKYVFLSIYVPSQQYKATPLSHVTTSFSNYTLCAQPKNMHVDKTTKDATFFTYNELLTNT